MKKLIMINGTMGVGKSTVARQLYQELPGTAVFLDGDWCWEMHPFVVNEENKRMVLNNIVYLLQSFLANSQLEYVVFCWVMHEEAIITAILERLSEYNFKPGIFTLLCEQDVLVQRLQKDIDLGIRSADIIERTISRLHLYKNMKTTQIDVTHTSVAQTVNELMTHIEQL